MKVVSFAKVEAIGAQRIATKGHQHRPPSGKDVFTFCYTSGTTGDPKGAMLTHENIMSAISGSDNILPVRIGDRHLSYLPLAHIFERFVMSQVYVHGASIAFSRGDPLLLIEDIQACSPTVLIAAPRVLNKIYDKASSPTPAFLKSVLFIPDFFFVMYVWPNNLDSRRYGCSWRV